MTTMTRTMSQATEGPRLHVEGGTIDVLPAPHHGGTGYWSQTQYISVGAAPERLVVAGELSKMEEILDYLKALYR